jgi:hypothetical protein
VALAGARTRMAPFREPGAAIKFRVESLTDVRTHVAPTHRPQSLPRLPWSAPPYSSDAKLRESPWYQEWTEGTKDGLR